MVCAPVRRDNAQALAVQAQTMLYLSCTMISSVDFAYNCVSCAKDWVSANCGTTEYVTSR